MQKLAAIFLTSDKPHYPFELPKGWCGPISEIYFHQSGMNIAANQNLYIRSKQLNKIYDYYGAARAIDKIDDYLFEMRFPNSNWKDGANLLSKSKNNANFAEGKYLNNHAHVLNVLLIRICLNMLLLF